MAKKTQVGHHGSTTAVATGTAIAHLCPTTPSAVLVTPKATGKTDIFVNTITATHFTLHFAGGGTLDCYFQALI